MSEPRITGGCQCGAIRYALTGPFDRPSICHCRMCQKAFGAYYAPLVSVPLGQFELTRGEIATFKSSDVTERGFCRNCGTPLSLCNIGGSKIDLSLGSLDDPAAIKPIMQFGMEGRMPWIGELDDLPGTITEEDDPEGIVPKIASTNHQHPDHDTMTWPPQGAER